MLCSGWVHLAEQGPALLLELREAPQLKAEAGATAPEARQTGGDVAGAAARRGARCVHRDDPRAHREAEVERAQLEVAWEARGEQSPTGASTLAPGS